MFIVVGLGNPGEKYKKIRHNLGFWVIDEFLKKNNFPDFKLSKKSNALISEAVLSRKKIILAKPQIFMNNSGKAIKAIFNKFSITQFSNKNLIVIHDDIDLPLGKIRIVKNRGSAGHKGVQSIINELGTKNFVRFRLGIRRKESKINEIDKFVLQKFTKQEKEILKEVIKKTVAAIEMAIKQGTEKSMQEYNG